MRFYTRIFTMAAAALLLLPACQNNDVAVYADFSTDKEVYELYEDIFLTNNSYAENAKVISSKWEWDGKKMWGLQPETPISFDKTGEFEITLTVTTDVGNVSSKKVKTVTIQDTNIKPVADFTWTPESGLRAGDSVQFTDKSSDADGSIVSWEWKFGSTVVNEQNPKFTFAEYGDVEVSLTVVDNMKGRSTKTVTIHIDKSVYSLELMWAKAYESDGDAFVKFTSPATNADGSVVYAFSTGYHLSAFSSEGEKLWSFDATKHNPSPYCNDGTKKGNSCTPSVDADGTVYIALAYNERDAKLTTYESGVYAVNGDGSEKWYFGYGNARYIAVIPVVFDDQIILTTKANPTQANYPEIWAAYGSQDNGHVLDKNGNFVQTLLVKQGNYGGSVGLKNGIFITHCNAKFGSRMYFKEGDKWKFYGPNTNQSSKSLGYYNSNTLETGDSGQMAVTPDGKVLIIYENVTKRVAASFGSVLYCYDTNKYVKDNTTPYEPEWVAGINGKLARYNGLGVVCGADGTIYVTSGSTGDVKARVTALTPTGEVKWESIADGNLSGSAAVDNEGYVYYNDYVTGRLVKLSPTDGKRVAELQLADEMRSSPTISKDGTIYCTGMKDGYPTLFAVRGSATGHADSWSQLGGNPSKTCVLY